MNISYPRDWKAMISWWSVQMRGASRGHWGIISDSEVNSRLSISGEPAALETKQSTIIGGPVEGKVALMFDDMISTAGSICGAAKLVHESGAKEIHLAASMEYFVDLLLEKLRESPIDSLVITDSIPLTQKNGCPISCSSRSPHCLQSDQKNSP